jgi:hypothetical protein
VVDGIRQLPRLRPAAADLDMAEAIVVRQD